MKHPAEVKSSAHETEGTGLPFFQTWRGVYLFVLASFVLWVALLILLTKKFS
jgi:hypothetical protein